MRSPVPARLAADPGPRLPRPVEFAAYFVTSEALANVAKYAQAAEVTVRVTRSDGEACRYVVRDIRAMRVTGGGS